VHNFSIDVSAMGSTAAKLANSAH